jgi:hypothetical protein
MKLKEVTLRGFRGFNEERSIPIHDRLTLISAPNSHGKTSISEGFEWLIYGFTSKVELADSKDEYRGSYRNIHLLEPEAPTVRVVIQEGTSTSELQATLSGSGAVLRVDKAVVASWPFSAQLEKTPKPFILQHALKDLLLAAPVDRFNRFAALLGFDDLTQVHKDLMAFCTKPPLPGAAKSLIADVDGLVLKVEADSNLAPIAKSIKKGYPQLAATRSLVKKHARSLVPPQTVDMDLLPALMKQRDEAISKVFKGTVAVAAFTPEELATLEAEEAALLARVTSEAMALFAELAKEAVQHRILREAQFYDLGVELLQEGPSVCPFCTRALSEADANHIHDHHASLVQKKQAATNLERAQDAVGTLLTDLGQRVSEYYRRVAGRTKGLLELQDALKQLEALLTGEHEGQVTTIADAIHELDDCVSGLVESGKEIRSALAEAQSSVQKPVLGLTVVEKLGEALVGYIAAGRVVRVVVNSHAQGLDVAQKALTEQLNRAAGTRTISLVIELLQNDRRIEKRMQLAATIDGLKELKTDVDAFVTKIMLDAISGELADEVMEWYKRIRTVGDPDVHFAGFDMKKTPQGGRVQIKASSYGKDLVSAVSSLSESKLNALGLCISIAINLKEDSPFEFLIIDDPIQSWDKDHEIQFINVIRELVERGKQVVLLSHNNEWIKQVRATCADLNGLYYEITGYTDSGPVISLLPWVEPKQRLQTILAVTEDQGADSIRLQQAEEELRQVLHQYACMLHEGVKGTPKNPSTLNADKVRKILTECGLPLALVNKVMTIFETLDDAHHASPGYSPNRQKLRQYYEIAVRLAKAVDAKLQEGKTISVVTTGKTA